MIWILLGVGTAYGIIVGRARAVDEQESVPILADPQQFSALRKLVIWVTSLGFVCALVFSWRAVKRVQPQTIAIAAHAQGHADAAAPIAITPHAPGSKERATAKVSPAAEPSVQDTDTKSSVHVAIAAEP